MATTLRINRRVTGNAGAPTALKSAELAYNMVDGVFYAGFGDDGSGNATSIRSFAKDDFNLKHRVPLNGTSGEVLVVDGSGNAVWGPAPQTGPTYTAGSGITISNGAIAADTSVVATVSGLALKANLASPALTGTPTAPTASAATSNTQLATTAFVGTAISNLVGGAGAAYDTLSELATLIQNDQSGIASLTTSVAGKLSKANNLSDLSDFSTSRANLGLGSMAVQAASAVAITGGTINGVILDGGTF
jgi:hypothetical protein